MPSRPHHYHDPCGVARALNLVGERWALLIVRELLHGPKRFSDLRRGLPTVSPNVLSQRLAELADRGVVDQRLLGPPVSAHAYELSDLGAQLEPALVALARWGSRAAAPEPGELSVDALVLAMRTTTDPDRSCPAGDYELNLEGDIIVVHVNRAGVTASRQRARRPVATITARTPTVRQVIFGSRPIDEVIDRGELQLAGDRRAARQFLRLFRRPTLIAAHHHRGARA
jgi:DNA-binding HxlR family transcriptional regulator